MKQSPDFRVVFIYNWFKSFMGIGSANDFSPAVLYSFSLWISIFLKAKVHKFDEVQCVYCILYEACFSVSPVCECILFLFFSSLTPFSISRIELNRVSQVYTLSYVGGWDRIISGWKNPTWTTEWVMSHPWYFILIVSHNGNLKKGRSWSIVLECLPSLRQGPG